MNLPPPAVIKFAIKSMEYNASRRCQSPHLHLHKGNTTPFFKGSGSQKIEQKQCQYRNIFAKYHMYMVSKGLEKFIRKPEGTKIWAKRYFSNILGKKCSANTAWRVVRIYHVMV